MKDMFTSEEQQSTNQNKKNKTEFGEKNKESSENDTNMCGRRKEKNSEAEISHAEKGIKNLPRSIQYYKVKGSHILKIMKEKKKLRTKGFCAKINVRKKEKCQSDMSREKRCSSSMVYVN